MPPGLLVLISTSLSVIVKAGIWCGVFLFLRGFFFGICFGYSVLSTGKYILFSPYW